MMRWDEGLQVVFLCMLTGYKLCVISKHRGILTAGAAALRTEAARAERATVLNISKGCLL
jgi:hypothetical protein